MLVLSEINYPGWQVYVDGQRQTIQTVGGLLRGVVLQKGQHSVVFVFSPWTIYAGCVFSALTVLALVVMGIIHRRDFLGRSL